MDKKKKTIIAVCVVIIILLIIALILVLNNKKTYTVTFDTKGGTEIASQTIEEDGVVTKPENPTKEGYIFLGWYISEESTVKYDFTAKVDKDFTLIAKWTEVGEEKEITDISIVTEQKELVVDEELTLVAKVMAGDEELKDEAIVWASSDEEIATVDQTGKVKAIKKGTVTITATVNGIKTEIKITVKEEEKEEEETTQTSTQPVSTNNSTTTKTTTGSSSTTTKPSTGSSTGTTTKPSTGGTTTEPEQPTVTYSAYWVPVEGSVAGEEILYIKDSNGNIVAGTATLTKLSGKQTTVSIPASGVKYVRNAITNITNITVS